MAVNEAESAVLEKVRGVEKEQCSFAEAGGEPPPHYGRAWPKSGGGPELPGDLFVQRRAIQRGKLFWLRHRPRHGA